VSAVPEQEAQQMGPGNEAVDDFRRRREVIRVEMGGTARIDALRAEGKLTARQRIEKFVDAGSFEEVGTFATSETPGDRDSTPGDGTIAGHATLGGAPVSVAADDITVKRASSSVISQKRSSRVYEQAVLSGNPSGRRASPRSAGHPRRSAFAGVASPTSPPCSATPSVARRSRPSAAT
jgi:acetyl-CoA carboxylase carboxyltransferase component